MNQFEYAIEERRQRRRLPEPGERRALRVRVGVSQAVVADTIGVARPSVSRYESGSSAPRGEVLRRYLDVLALLAAEAASDPEMPDAASGRRLAKTTGMRSRHVEF